MLYINDKIVMNTDELLITYKVISEIMNNNKLNGDNSWRHVKNWLSNKICDQILNEKENK